MTRWYVYGYMKERNGKVSMDELIDKFYDSTSNSVKEIMEGISEYNLMARCNSYYTPSELVDLDSETA